MRTPDLLAALPLFVLSLGPSVTVHSSEPAASDPCAVLEEFCARDLHGDRLSSDSYRGMLHLIGYEVEPGWEGILAVSGFTVGQPRLDGDDVEIPVTYAVEGLLEADSRWTPHRTKEAVTIRLSRQEESWRVVGPVVPPHVSVRVLLLGLEENWSRCCEPPQECCWKRAPMANAIRALKRIVAKGR